uniref:Uncharacterized protein n=1 Tax=Romanomermis culicivorax TaxID=13658 RepID=A0A915IV89_ROMCU
MQPSGMRHSHPQQQPASETQPFACETQPLTRTVDKDDTDKYYYSSCKSYASTMNPVKSTKMSTKRQYSKAS